MLQTLAHEFTIIVFARSNLFVFCFSHLSLFPSGSRTCVLHSAAVRGSYSTCSRVDSIVYLHVSLKISVQL